MSDTLRLRVVLDLANRALGPLKQIASGSSGAAKALKAARDRLKELNAQQNAVSGFQRQQAALSETTNKLKVLRQQLDAMRQSGSANAAQLAAQEAAVNKQTAAFDKQRASVLRLRSQLNTLGVSKINSAGLKSDIDAATAAIDKQAAHLKRLSDLRTRFGKAMLHTGAAVGVGYAMNAAGMRMAHGMQRPMAEGKHAATEELRINALGLGDQSSQDAIKFAKGMKTYGTSMVENLGLMRDALTTFSDVHHAEMVTPLLAKMKFANEAVFGAQDGAENEAKFMDMLKVIELRGGLSSEAAFTKQANIVQQVLTATGGRVGPTEWLNMIKTGGVAAKGLTDQAFYYQMEPLVQEMGGNRVGTAMMSAYQNVYQGKTTKRSAMLMDDLGLIADPSKVKHDKVGQISQLGVGALKGSEIFRENQFEWMEKILLPALAAKGITEKQQVLDSIGGIFSNRTASGLFAQMYLQRDQVHKNAALNARADGIDGLYNKAKASPVGSELELLKRRDDLYQELSSSVMPVYVQALSMITDATKWLLGVLREYPMLTKAVGVGLGVIAASMAVLGAILIPVALVAGKAMLLRFVFSRLAIGLMGTQIAARAVSIGMGLLYRAGYVAGRVFAFLLPILASVGRGILLLGRFLLMTPLGIALALIATAAYLIWRNWDGIKGGLMAIWTQLSTAASAWWASASAGAQALWQDLVTLKDRFFSAGADLMSGLVNGITSRLTAVREAVVGAADAVGAWFREKLGIASPSRVFMEYGGWISEGAALGITGGQGAVRNAALAMATAATAAMPAMADETALRLDSRPPLSAPMQSAGSAAQGGASYNITINAAPGMDVQALARAVSAELDRRERAGRSRVLSSLGDID